MTRAAIDILNMAEMLDNEKANIIKIRKDKVKSILNDSKSGMFILYYAFMSLFDDPEDLELDTVSVICKNEKNAERIKAVYSAMSSGAAWTSATVFVTTIQAILGDDIDSDAMIPYESEEIIWAIMIMLAIDGAELFPAKKEVTGYICSSLAFYGYVAVPLPLRFDSIVREYKTDFLPQKDAYIMSIRDLYEMDSSLIPAGISPRDLNYLIDNTEIATYLMGKYNEMVSAWRELSA